MSDSPGNTSTPATSASPEAAATPSAQQAPPTTPATAPAQPAEAKTAPVESKTEAKAPDQPLFSLPEDLKLNPDVVSKFETQVKGKMADGKLAVSPQDVLDMFVEHARDADARWQQQLVAQDREWETASKQRFNPRQLAAAETGIAFITSKQLAAAEKSGIKDAMPFRDLAQQFRNHPEFVEAMRIVGESLAEDTFDRDTRVMQGKKSAGQALYPNSKPS